jgi:predicted phage tail component-like protein
MKNFVIINGVNSNTINGLGINELPPISKPSMRVQQEVIDGRDGDITTNLGYSAYDKTITIGLFGTGYDINDIISFFNGEGTIVFSNEDDKYYKYKIINQIDYEALQKFKEASITFHCQPFKYPLEETPLEIEYDYIEQEGETLTLNNTGNAVMKNKLYPTETSQEGTPTPDYPQDIHTINGDNEVVVCGKNLFDKSKYQNLITDNERAISGYCIKSIQLQPNTQYTISQSAGTTSSVVLLMNKVPNVNDTNYFDCRKTSDTKTYTTDSSGKLYIGCYWNVNDTQCNERLNECNIQIEKCNEATTYEPSQSNSALLTLGDKEICKIDNYEDKIFKAIKGDETYDSLSVEEKNTLNYGKWYLRKAIGKVVLNGSENWTYVNSAFRLSMTNLNTTGNDVIKQISNYFKAITYSSNWSSYDYFVCYTLDGNVVLKNKDITNINDFKTWLSTHNTIVYYVLATPVNELFNDTIQDQLEDIYNNMISYEGTTNIGQINNDKAFIISAKALEQGSDEVVVNNIGNATSKPLIALEGTGNINIYLDGTQVLQANVEDKMNIDIDTLEAYNPDTSALLNRQVIGNYNSMTLPSGNSTIKINGNLTKATITNYERWL